METYHEKWQKDSIMLRDQILHNVSIDCIDFLFLYCPAQPSLKYKIFVIQGKFDFKHSVSVFWKVYTIVTSCSVWSDMKQNDLLQKFSRKFT